MNLEELIKTNIVEGYCILSNEQLSTELDKSHSSIKRGLRSLKEKGIISIEGNTNKRRIKVHSSTGSVNKNDMAQKVTKTLTVDLSVIPEEYHEIWTTDWNAGRNSTMLWSERSRILKLFQEYHHTYQETPLIEDRREILKEEVLGQKKLIEMTLETKELINSL